MIYPDVPQPILEGICRVLADTNEGITGSEIGLYLSQLKIKDVAPDATKWKRLYNALAVEGNSTNSVDKIFEFIQLALAPSRYLSNQDFFGYRVRCINEQLAFVGIQYLLNGQFDYVKKAETISEAKQRVDSLKSKLENQNAHRLVFQYCKEELLANNYFHAVFESMKGLEKRIQELSGSDKSGRNLVEYVFSKNPVLIINNFIKKSEQDEQEGFKNILCGLMGMFRNPEAHELKVEWPINEQDALEIFGMISYCHRRLDDVQKIRMA